MILSVLDGGDIWQVIYGAGLGASFYVLIRSYRFLSDRTFDPDYANVYLCRLVLGFVSGVVLALVAPESLTRPSSPGGPSFAIGVIALLGGFAAEAVEQVLNRLVETLLAAINGDGSAKSKAQAEADMKKAKADISLDLAQIQGLVQDQKVKDSIKQAMDKLK
jgi:hypothetical protein